MESLFIFILAMARIVFLENIIQTIGLDICTLYYKIFDIAYILP